MKDEDDAMEVEVFDQLETEIVTEEQTFSAPTETELVTEETQFDAAAPQSEEIVATEEEVQTEIVEEEQVEDQPKIYHFAWQVCRQVII